MDSAAPSVGLAGDGDEIAAIYDVEREFGIKFDYDDAPNWITTGDLFASLKSRVSETGLDEAQLWDRFTVALSQETGVAANLLTPESPLTLESHAWRKMHEIFAGVWIGRLSLIVLLASQHL